MKVVETTSVEADRCRLNELHPRSGFDMGGGVILQDELTAAERVKYDEIKDRLERLKTPADKGHERALELDLKSISDVLTPAEQAELEALRAWLPPRCESDGLLKEFFERGRDVARPSPPHEDSTEMHKRPLADRQANAAVKVLPLPDKDETSAEPD
jgi:hypothetical protein